MYVHHTRNLRLRGVYHLDLLDKQQPTPLMKSLFEKMNFKLRDQTLSVRSSNMLDVEHIQDTSYSSSCPDTGQKWCWCWMLMLVLDARSIVASRLDDVQWDFSSALLWRTPLVGHHFQKVAARSQLYLLQFTVYLCDAFQLSWTQANGVLENTRAALWTARNLNGAFHSPLAMFICNS